MLLASSIQKAHRAHQVLLTRDLGVKVQEGGIEFQKAHRAHQVLLTRDLGSKVQKGGMEFQKAHRAHQVLLTRNLDLARLSLIKFGPPRPQRRVTSKTGPAIYGGRKRRTATDSLEPATPEMPIWFLLPMGMLQTQPSHTVLSCLPEQRRGSDTVNGRQARHTPVAPLATPFPSASRQS
jgi:hypothetical protein